MPRDDGIGLHNAHNGAPRGPQAREPNPEASVSRAELGSFHGVFEHAERLTERKIVGREAGREPTYDPKNENPPEKTGRLGRG